MTSLIPWEKLLTAEPLHILKALSLFVTGSHGLSFWYSPHSTDKEKSSFILQPLTPFILRWPNVRGTEPLTIFELH